MSADWYHQPTGTSGKIHVICNPPQLDGESESDYRARWESRYAWLMDKFPPNV